MSLREKQSQFAHSLAKLILHAESLGYQVTMGDCFRDSRCNYGSRASLHRKRLAVDLNLFKDGVYLADGNGHGELHDFWDIIGGSERIYSDLNHYSFEHQGMR